MLLGVVAAMVPAGAEYRLLCHDRPQATLWIKADTTNRRHECYDVVAPHIECALALAILDAMEGSNG